MQRNSSSNLKNSASSKKELAVLHHQILSSFGLLSFYLLCKSTITTTCSHFKQIIVSCALLLFLSTTFLDFLHDKLEMFGLKIEQSFYLKRELFISIWSLDDKIVYPPCILL